MLRRPAIIALILFEAFWLNVVIPGHTRGSLTMPCACCSAATTPAGACPRCAAAGAAHHSPTPTDRAHCALCFFAAHLSIPPMLDLSTPKLRFLNYVGAEAARHLFAREVCLPFNATGPPAAV